MWEKFVTRYFYITLLLSFYYCSYSCNYSLCNFVWVLNEYNKYWTLLYVWFIYDSVKHQLHIVVLTYCYVIIIVYVWFIYDSVKHQLPIVVLTYCYVIIIVYVWFIYDSVKHQLPIVELHFYKSDIFPWQCWKNNINVRCKYSVFHLYDYYWINGSTTASI